MTDHKYKTSKRIRFASDNWGGRDETHLEIAWAGQTIMIQITDELIHIVGPIFTVNQTSLNAVDIVPGNYTISLDLGTGEDFS
jgi:hypothetical protein